MLGHVLAFGLSAGLIKGLSGAIPVSEQVFLRSATAAIIMFFAVRMVGTPLVPPIWRLLVFRGVVGFAGLALMYLSLSMLPLTIAMLLTWTTPVFVAIISRIFLKEHLPLKAVACMIACFAGLSLTITAPSGAPSDLGTITSAGVLVGVVAALCAGTAFVAVRAATISVGPDLIVLYFAGLSMILSAPIAMGELVVPDGAHAAGLLGLCLLSVVSDACKTRAYKHAAAGVVSTMALFSVAVSAVLGWLLFDETLSAMQWTGVAILTGAITVLSASRKKPAPLPSPAVQRAG
ncbi:hypothetical protein TSH100_27450 [Azospirillum sp. TSH100]|nr:hypothetical protein TSH100_27450 [Azospirillum sp. TSH100]